MLPPNMLQNATFLGPPEGLCSILEGRRSSLIYIYIYSTDLGMGGGFPRPLSFRTKVSDLQHIKRSGYFIPHKTSNFLVLSEKSCRC